MRSECAAGESGDKGNQCLLKTALRTMSAQSPPAA